MRISADYERFESLRIIEGLQERGRAIIPSIWQRFVSRTSKYLMDTGLANQNYSFIEQGQIGEIVKARPQETRELRGGCWDIALKTQKIYLWNNSLKWKTTSILSIY